ncbi:hypothetical protein AVL50_12465 [Flammeovirga sp. SJP92]|nr:hypothetical protein AVL50_12465 [Flammeovirga sp. SJP92]
MNIYRWTLVIIASFIGIGNIWFLDFNDLSFMNNIYEYCGMIIMFGITYLLTTQSRIKKSDKNSIS